MRGRFHALAGAAGALACGLAAAVWCAAAPPPFGATAIVSVDAAADIPAAYDVSALRALATSDAVLRQAALDPQAAAAVAREAQPTLPDRLLSLLSARPNQADTLSRATDLLAQRIEVERGALARSARIHVHMQGAAGAAAVANAVANAIVAAHNNATAKIDRRLDQTRGERLARAEHRRDIARARLAALRANDFAPTGSIAPVAKAPPAQAAHALAEAQRAVAAAQSRRAEAARIYGPRHPQMIQIETDARRAAAALQAAHAKLAAAPNPPRRPLAEGGPDPRIGELADAQEETERAQAAYDREAARFAMPNRQAQIAEQASAPSSRERPPNSFVVAASTLLGFALFGAAPGLGARNPSTRRTQPRRPRTIMRDGALDAASARRLVDRLDIAASDGARRVFVCGESAGTTREAMRTLAMAALAQGWRPLVIGSAGRQGLARGATVFDRRSYATSGIPTCAGDLLFARPVDGWQSAGDADIAFDLVLFGEDTAATHIDVAVWIGAAAPPSDLPAVGQVPIWIVPEQIRSHA
ncbi:MAG: hypothetical protein KDJ25_08980 [Rhodoblastus sp.]|nr:hypothetical protein [Rhodoblastus sp.]